MNRDRIRRIVAVKKRLRDAQKNFVTVAGQRVDAADQRIALEARMRELKVQELTELGARAAPDVSASAEMVSMAHRRVEQAREAREVAERELDEVRQALHEATREMRQVEALERRIASRVQLEARRREQRESDEVASQRRGSHEDR
ncbi:MAG: hypothetical protein OXU20_18285 [Myxococcales bacterium]|nr:hypothetical protein [Myxococcales bacterium]